MPNDNSNPNPNPTAAPDPENYGLPANFVPIDSVPIIPSNPAAGTNPYTSGTLPQNFGLQPDSLGAQYKGGGTPFVRLMPVQGAPSTNAQSQSVAEKIVSETINNTTNTSGEFISLQTNGVINAEQDLLNLQSGTNTTAVYVGAGAVQINVPTMGAEYQTVQQAGVAKPQEPVLNFLAPITAVDNPGNTSTDIAVSVMVGDSGSGGVKGLVPAPGAGDAAAGKYLKADGTFEVPPGTGGAAYYQTIEEAGVSKPQEPNLNFLAPFVVTDNPGNSSTDISLNSSVASVDLTGQNNNISATTIVTPGANGYYRISGWAVSTNTPSGGSIPAISILFTDADSNTVQTAVLFSAKVAVNAAGSYSFLNTSTAAFPVWSGTFYAKSGVAIQYEATSYAAGSGTALVYALHLRLEGPL